VVLLSVRAAMGAPAAAVAKGPELPKVPTFRFEERISVEFVGPAVRRVRLQGTLFLGHPLKPPSFRQPSRSRPRPRPRPRGPRWPPYSSFRLDGSAGIYVSRPTAPSTLLYLSPLFVAAHGTPELYCSGISYVGVTLVLNPILQRAVVRSEVAENLGRGYSVRSCPRCPSRARALGRRRGRRRTSWGTLGRRVGRGSGRSTAFSSTASCRASRPSR